MDINQELEIKKVANTPQFKGLVEYLKEKANSLYDLRNSHEMADPKLQVVEWKARAYAAKMIDDIWQNLMGISLSETPEDVEEKVKRKKRELGMS